MAKDCYDCRNIECPFNKAPTAEDFEYYECPDFKAQYAEELDRRNKASLREANLGAAEARVNA